MIRIIKPKQSKAMTIDEYLKENYIPAREQYGRGQFKTLKSAVVASLHYKYSITLFNDCMFFQGERIDTKFK